MWENGEVPNQEARPLRRLAWKARSPCSLMRGAWRRCYRPGTEGTCAGSIKNRARGRGAQRLPRKGWGCWGPSWQHRGGTPVSNALRTLRSWPPRLTLRIFLELHHLSTIYASIKTDFLLIFYSFYETTYQSSKAAKRYVRAFRRRWERR